jgi:hypothetical protein
MPRLARFIVTLAAATSACAAFVAATGGTSGCATEETHLAEDAGQQACQRGPHLFCQTVGPEAPGCNTDEGTHPLLSRLPRATRYGLGCVVNFVGERDEQGDCRNEGVCKCGILEPTSVTPLNVDGGASDAALPPGPVADAGPAWNCAP